MLLSGFWLSAPCPCSLIFLGSWAFCTALLGFGFGTRYYIRFRSSHDTLFLRVWVFAPIGSFWDFGFPHQLLLKGWGVRIKQQLIRFYRIVSNHGSSSAPLLGEESEDKADEKPEVVEAAPPHGEESDANAPKPEEGEAEPTPKAGGPRARNAGHLRCSMLCLRERRRGRE